MVRFQRPLVIALVICALTIGSEVPSSSSPLETEQTKRNRTRPRNPHNNGPRDVGGRYGGGPGYEARDEHYEFSSRGWAILDVLANDSYPPGSTWGFESAGYAYLSYTECPDSNRVCVYYEPIEGEREYPDRIDYYLSDSQGRKQANASAYVTMP